MLPKFPVSATFNTQIPHIFFASLLSATHSVGPFISQPYRKISCYFIENETCNVRINVTLRRGRVTVVAAGKNYIFWVCVCSFSYPACNAIALYCHLWPVRQYNIFPHYLIRETIFGRKKSYWWPFPSRVSSILILLGSGHQKPARNLPVPNVQYKIPDNGQRRCPKHVEFYSFIHSIFCLTTGPKPPLKLFLHIVRSRASSFKWEYSLLSLRSSSSFLRPLPRLLVTSISPFIFPSMTCFRRQFMC